MARRKKYWTCRKCKTKFKRLYLETICDACKEVSLQESQEKFKKNNLWEQTKRRIKNRDNNKCKICFTFENLQIHHWDKNRMHNEYNNLITLCSYCHSQIHTIYRKVKKGKPKTRIVKMYRESSCVRCGKKFKTKRNEKIFCSKNCAKRSRNK